MSSEALLESLPDLKRLYLKAALRRRSRPRASTPRPDLSVGVTAIGADHQMLSAYRQICAIVDDGRLPPTYPQVLATPLHATIVAHRDFPLPAMGLVHLENRIEQIRPIHEGERFDIHCHISGWEWDERLGIRFAIETTLSVDNQTAWRSELWALARGAPDELIERKKKHHDPPRSGEPPGAIVSIIADAPADLGRRYAAICSDYNPIHLHPLTAKPFGFRRPIIHGMWTMARCWAELADHAPGDELEFTVRFKKPLYLPSRVHLSATTEGDDIEYQCRSLDGRRLHLSGLLRGR